MIRAPCRFFQQLSKHNMIYIIQYKSCFVWANRPSRAHRSACQILLLLTLLATNHKQPVIKTVQKAEEVAEQLKDFAQFNGHEELSLVLRKVSDLLHQIKLRSPKLQTTITDFFTSC